MRKEFVASALGILLFAAGSARADLLYTFNSPTGDLGTSETYTTGGVSVTARGYTSANAASTLWGKSDPVPDENGLGMKFGSDNEIDNSHYVQLDLTDVFNKLNVSSLTMQIGSVQAGESYRIYGSNSVASKGTLLVSGSLDLQNISLPSVGTYKYYSVTANIGDVLITSLAVAGTSKEPPPSAPEPASFVLFGIGAVGLLGFARRQRRAAALKLA